jgi:hypothetical protein
VIAVSQGRPKLFVPAQFIEVSRILFLLPCAQDIASARPVNGALRGEFGADSIDERNTWIISAGTESWTWKLTTAIA